MCDGVQLVREIDWWSKVYNGTANPSSLTILYLYDNNLTENTTNCVVTDCGVYENSNYEGIEEKDEQGKVNDHDF